MFLPLKITSCKLLPTLYFMLGVLPSEAVYEISQRNSDIFWNLCDEAKESRYATPVGTKLVSPLGKFRIVENGRP